jgi:hypothetical protein
MFEFFVGTDGLGGIGLAFVGVRAPWHGFISIIDFATANPSPANWYREERDPEIKRYRKLPAFHLDGLASRRLARNRLEH